MAAQEPGVREPAIDPHRALGLRAEAMVGHEHHDGVRARGGDQLPNAGVELGEERVERGLHVVRRWRRIGSKALPEVVLCAVGRVVHDARGIHRPARKETQCRRGPEPRLPAERAEVRERPVPIVRVGAAEALRCRRVDLVLAEVRGQLRGLRQALAGRREHAADDPAVRDGTEGIRRGHIDDADASPGAARHVPEGRRAEIAGVREAGGGVAVRRQALERVHAVTAGILSRHERRPGG